MTESNKLKYSFKQQLLSNGKEFILRNWQLIIIKPVLILYVLQYSITQSITSQLWLDKTCEVTFRYNDTVCKNLTAPEFSEMENIVQKQVASFNIVTNYLSGIPPIIISLYLGPLSDTFRQTILAIPFIGHLIAGVVPFLVLYLQECPPQIIWLYNLYLLFGGYSVLQIAMYAHISDSTSSRNRTTIMSILYGLSLIVMPIGEFAGGQIYQVGGYATVYIVSLFVCSCGLIYVLIMMKEEPYSNVKKYDGLSNKKDTTETNEGTNSKRIDTRNRNRSCADPIVHVFREGNKSIIESYRCLVKPRNNGRRKFILSLLGISLFSGMQRGVHKNGLLFTEKVYDWNVVDYTKYRSYECTIYAIRTFITTPILCNVLNIHDCMLAIIGGLSTVASDITIGLSTKGWMMYYGTGLSLMGGMLSTPLRSMLSKCVESHEYGKIFTLSSVASSLASLVSSVIIQEMYKYTLDTFPGAIYLFHGGIELVAVGMMSIVYVWIKRYEQNFGPLGQTK